MKIGLFAAREVGLQVAGVFGESGIQPACLVLDAAEAAQYRERIQEAAGIGSARVLNSDQLYTPHSVERIRDLELDLIILAWWPYILKEPLISLPHLGCLNFHPSLLPYNRGKHYNFWAIVEEAPFGVTLHFVNEAIDAGDIAFQARIETSWEDTGQTLYEKAQQRIVRLFRDVFDDILAGQIPRIPQEENLATFHFARELESAARIDLDRTYTARELLNILRARTFPPHPAAWFEADGERYEVRVQITRTSKSDQAL